MSDTNSPTLASPPFLISLILLLVKDSFENAETIEVRFDDCTDTARATIWPVPP